MHSKTAVVAIGGNSLIKDKDHASVEDQYQAAKETTRHIADMIQDGWHVAIGHGNGPQVGFILRQSELAHRVDNMHEVPLDVCGAESQGMIGYMLQQNLQNILFQRKINQNVVTLITQVLVDPKDPAFSHPSKPIGSFMDEEEALRRQRDFGWSVIEDAGRGWRRVVASPTPIEVVELDSIKQLVEMGIIVITVGGGGIPVWDDGSGDYQGIAAVIDKDLASSLLAVSIQADLFLISTAVEKIALHFGSADQVFLDHMSLTEAKKHLQEGIHFASGSMAPKIKAIINYLENGGKRAIVTNPENIGRALRGETGTVIEH